MGWRWWWWVFLVVVAGDGNVSYDGRSLIIDGQRRILFSGSLHYPRATPEMWGNLIGRAKEGGLDVIQTYVFWNLHEPQPGQYDFSGRYDLVRFIKQIQAQGLYVCLRIGPYIESEWTYGGFPFWLHDIPGIVYRSDNEPFKFYMQNFTSKIVNLMKSERLYASQGGPIILSQIENEYQNVEAAFHEKGPSYVIWAAKMAVGLQTGVPWIMCKQTDAPDPLINTCNGMRCGETFSGPNSPNKPTMWTENWTSFYQVYGDGPYIRSAEDIAFHTALFIAKKGCYVNYYMYHGGTNFGRTASAYFITGYYDQAPLDEYGLLRQPKYDHLRDLHAAVKNCSTPLLEGVQSNFSLGEFQQAYVFEDDSGSCAAFLVNNDLKNNASVQFQNISFQLLPKSISILPDCKNIIFNTAKVNSEFNQRTMTESRTFNTADCWEECRETVPNFLDTYMQSDMLLEQMNLTKDKTDYLWYTLSFEPNSSCAQPMLHVESLGHVAHAYVNNQHTGAAHGSHNVKGFNLDTCITLLDGINNISILSVLVGLPDSGAFLESKFTGLTKVEIQCVDTELNYTLTNYTWGYQMGLSGENLKIYEDPDPDSFCWSKIDISGRWPLTWYKTVFDAPPGEEPVALNLSSMGKGQVWVNGQSIGRYWVSFQTPNGSASQEMYHIPRSFLNDAGNSLILVEEFTGDPLQISLVTITATKLDAQRPSSIITE